jgi:two-component system, OmpR family, osmolarity sensor histidine kinase EnvZ
MRFSLNSMWFRFFVAQLLVVLIAIAVIAITFAQHRQALVAQVVAPLWAQSIQQARVIGADHSPSDAMVPRRGRYQALIDEMAEHGVTVVELRVSPAARVVERTGERANEPANSRATSISGITWLAVRDQRDTPAALRWYGFDNAFLSQEERGRRWPIPVLLIALALIASALVSWTVNRPIRRLQLAIEQYKHDKTVSALSTADSGPLELQALERAFAQMTQERQRIEQDRSLMLAGISHDLRSPLARIRLTADLLPNMPSGQDSGADYSADFSAAKASIMRNIDIADRHLTSFLEFAAPPAVTSAQSMITLDALQLRDIWRIAAEQALQDQASLTVEVTEGLPTIRVPAAPLVRILAIGLENAQKHGALPITARVLNVESKLVFEIEDAGSGITPHDRDRVMRPFERGERARTTPGTGLGLALAEQLATRLNANVTLDQHERGLIFRLALPLTLDWPK